MEILLTPLGTNGFIPTHGRHTMSFLVEIDGRFVVLDAGTGLSRLLLPPLADRIAAVDHLDILLTHYHLDHTVGLSYLSGFWAGKRVTLHVPGPALVDGGGREALDRLLAPPLFPIPLAEFPMELEVRVYGAAPWELAGCSLRTRRQRHTGGSTGLVLAERLAYLTDCETDDDSAPFARGAELLLHEVWVDEAEAAAGVMRRGHSTVEEVARVAREAGVGALLPVHHRPTRTPDEVEAFRRRLRDLADLPVLAVGEGQTVRVGG